MSRIRGISEKVLYAYNPLPNLTEADLIERTGLDLLTPSQIPPFEIYWKYGGTLENERIYLKPGKFLPLRESESVEFMREFGEIGMVCVEDPHDKAEVKKAAAAGLRKAVSYWKARGAKRLLDLRKTHSYSRDDMEDHKYDHWVYYLNEEKAKAVEEELKRVEGRAGGAKKGS